MSKHLLLKGNFKHFTNNSGKTDRFEKTLGLLCEALLQMGEKWSDTSLQGSAKFGGSGRTYEQGNESYKNLML